MVTRRKKPVRRSKADAAKLAREVRSRLAVKHEVQKEIESFEAKIRLKRKEANEKAIKDAFKKVGVDYDAIMGESKKRLKVQRRATDRAYAKARRKMMSYIKKENRRREVMRNVYLKTYQKELKALQGNPELKFYIATFNDTELVRAPSGLVGSGSSRRDFPSWSYSDAMSAAYIGASEYEHFFYPEAHVSTGDYTDSMTVELHQHLSLSHYPLSARHRTFLCSGFRLDLSGIGYAEGREGDFCPGTLETHGTRNVHMTMDMSIFQLVGGERSVETDLLSDAELFSAHRNHSGPVTISESTHTYPASFFLLGPGEGGSYIIIQFTLKTTVSMAGKEGHATLNFNREETGGIRLGCITLIGEYYDV